MRATKASDKPAATKGQHNVKHSRQPVFFFLPHVCYRCWWLQGQFVWRGQRGRHARNRPRWRPERVGYKARCPRNCSVYRRLRRLRVGPHLSHTGRRKGWRLISQPTHQTPATPGFFHAHHVPTTTHHLPTTTHHNPPSSEFLHSRTFFDNLPKTFQSVVDRSTI